MKYLFKTIFAIIYWFILLPIAIFFITFIITPLIILWEFSLSKGINFLKRIISEETLHKLNSQYDTANNKYYYTGPINYILDKKSIMKTAKDIIGK